MKIKSGYIQSFIISTIILILGFIIEYLSGGKGVTLPGWPLNFIILVTFFAYILILHFFWKSPVKNWLSSIQATVGVITVYAFLVLLMGFIPQIDDKANEFIRKMGLSHINRSWEFMLLSVYMLLILGLATIRRFKKMNFKNTAFFLNHAGIWLVIASASLATGDLQRLTLPLYEGESSHIAFKNDKEIIKLPFRIKLQSFDIQKFTPNIILFNPSTRKIYNQPNVNYQADTSNIIKYKNYTIKILKKYNNAIQTDTGYINNDSAGIHYAVLVKVTTNGKTKTGWISSSNYKVPSKALFVDENLGLTLSMPEEKKYTSIITLDTTKNIKIIVNEPYKYKGYNIYQQSYDLSTGRKISVLELVKDPWLPVVYTGLIMLLIGALMLLWIGNEEN